MTSTELTVNQERPCVFLSYSWSSPDHQESVKKLAKELTELNIHVLFDVWDLQTGDDTIEFMERSINDPKVTKVLILADKSYVDKANGRAGGVGTETQIISPKIYSSTDPRKFALVVYERDEENKPYLPAYYQSRMFIDFSDPTRYADEFERLQRWIFDKPADVRPAYGVTPLFVTEPDAIILGTDTQVRRVLDAFHNGKSTALGAFTEYLNACVKNLGRFKIQRDNSKEFDDQVFESINSLRPFRDQLLTVIDAVTTHTESKEYGIRLHSFFEKMFELTQPPKNAQGFYRSDYDNFAFALHEAFVCTCALLFKKQRFDLAAELISVDYYLPQTFDSTEAVSSHGRFSTFEITSLQERKRRLSSKRMSIQADLLVERLEGSLINQEELIQTDFLLFLRSKIINDRWFPTTYMFASMNRPLEIFARASSKAYFEKIRPLLGVDSLAEFESFIDSLQGYQTYGGAFGGSYKALVNLTELAKRP